MSELTFGTAGIRGRMGDGPGEFNGRVVARATWGLAHFLIGRQVAGPVVVGFDARHGSAQFATDAAAVLVAAGRSALVLPRPLPTPVLAFAVRHLGAAAGVMVTASHNPAADNGYKVYLADGAQVAPPADAAIEAAMAAAPHDVPRGTGAGVVPGDVLDAYVARAAELLVPGPRDLRVVHTPLHGVAGPIFTRVWAAAGFPPVAAVPEQAEPDPDFPTVTFPNPEEPGALDLAAALAARVGADLVLAHDPDGDRCAAMVPAPEGYRALTGDEVGVLLADHLLSDGRLPPQGTVATTIVSSPLLGRIAAAAGVRHELTLTGFKWLARVPDLSYAYEEALGYCVDPGGVRDKDGITAALLVAELAAQARAEGGTLTTRLDDLARRHGAFASLPRSIRTSDPAAATRATADLLSAPPRELAGTPVERVEDLTAGAVGLPPTPGVRITAGALTAVLRPSGTEPKLKLYLHGLGEPGARDLAADQARLHEQLARAADALLARLPGMPR